MFISVLKALPKACFAVFFLLLAYLAPYQVVGVICCIFAFFYYLINESSYYKNFQKRRIDKQKDVEKETSAPSARDFSGTKLEKLHQASLKEPPVENESDTLKPFVPANLQLDWSLYDQPPCFDQRRLDLIKPYAVQGQNIVKIKMTIENNGRIRTVNKRFKVPFSILKGGYRNALNGPII